MVRFLLAGTLIGFLCGCDPLAAAVAEFSSTERPAKCAQGTDIAKVSAVAVTTEYVVYELDYCYDGSFGENVRINLAPINKQHFIPHAPIQAMIGQNQVALTLVAQNFETHAETVPLSHLEISLDLLVSERLEDSHKLLSQVIPLQAILHLTPLPTLVGSNS